MEVMIQKQKGGFDYYLNLDTRDISDRLGALFDSWVLDTERPSTRKEAGLLLTCDSHQTSSGQYDVRLRVMPTLNDDPIVLEGCELVLCKNLGKEHRARFDGRGMLALPALPCGKYDVRLPNILKTAACLSRGLLSGYSLGWLAPDDQPPVSRHVRVCERCRSVYDVAWESKMRTDMWLLKLREVGKDIDLMPDEAVRDQMDAAFRNFLEWQAGPEFQRAPGLVQTGGGRRGGGAGSETEYIPGRLLDALGRFHHQTVPFRVLSGPAIDPGGDFRCRLDTDTADLDGYHGALKLRGPSSLFDLGGYPLKMNTRTRRFELDSQLSLKSLGLPASDIVLDRLLLELLPPELDP